MLFNNEHQIGLLNAWIGTVLAWANMFFLVIINKNAIKRLMNMSWYTSNDKFASGITMIFMIVIFVYSIWLPLKIGTVWFYIGCAVYVTGTVVNLVALYNYGKTPEDEPIRTGMYKISRNPLYLCWIIVLIGLCIACTSLILFVLLVIYSIPTHILILDEERYCLKTYGELYENYMKKVPRYILCF